MIDILNEVYTKAFKYAPTVKGESVWIKCPYHGGGHERTPSCRINLKRNKYPIGFFYCYGCGKHGNWNDLAKDLGLAEITEEEKQETEDLFINSLSKEQLDYMYNRQDNIDLSLSVEWSSKDDWRGISGELLAKLGAKLVTNIKNGYMTLFLPCYQNRELKGGINAKIERKPGEVGYYNTKGEWVKKSLFPYDFVKAIYKDCKRVIALVEGPRDALNLIQHGLPALAILGSQNWSSYKKDLLYILNPNKIVLMFDGDEAGNHAYEVVSESLNDYGELIKFQFPEGKDPADLTKEQVEKLLRRF